MLASLHFPSTASISNGSGKAEEIRNCTMLILINPQKMFLIQHKIMKSKIKEISKNLRLFELTQTLV